MELYKNIEQLLEKYFQGETSIAEEKELKVYFSSSDVAQHLEQYKQVFGYFSVAKEQQFEKTIPIASKKRSNVAWLSVAASVVIMLGVGTFYYFNSSNQEVSGKYGTYDDPEIALKETQRALDLISKNVNVGIESVTYINEYDKAKDRIFIE